MLLMVFSAKAAFNYNAFPRAKVFAASRLLGPLALEKVLDVYLNLKFFDYCINFHILLLLLSTKARIPRRVICLARRRLLVDFEVSAQNMNEPCPIISKILSLSGQFIRIEISTLIEKHNFLA